MISGWWRGVQMLWELHRLQREVERKPIIAAEAVRILSRVKAQVAHARKMSPGDEAAAVGVMQQVNAALASQRHRQDVAYRAATELAQLYLRAQIQSHHGYVTKQTAAKVVERIEETLGSQTNEDQHHTA